MIARNRQASARAGGRGVFNPAAVDRAGQAYILTLPDGGLAQLGERLAGSQKVRGSSPLSSTQWNRKPFDQYVEGLSHYRYKSCVNETAVQADDF